MKNLLEYLMFGMPTDTLLFITISLCTIAFYINRFKVDVSALMPKWLVISTMWTWAHSYIIFTYLSAASFLLTFYAFCFQFRNGVKMCVFSGIALMILAVLSFIGQIVIHGGIIEWKKTKTS